MKQRVSYFYNFEDEFNYGEDHPMKVTRLKKTHDLIHKSGIYRDIHHCYIPTDASYEHLTAFHTNDYIHFLSTIGTLEYDERLVDKYLLSEVDCPAVPGVYDFCKKYTACSIVAAHTLNFGMTDIAINWSGGFHHAKSNQASGFCYVNDVVLAIMELLKTYDRVLYVDIDVHHGDGVEEAFVYDSRVMTVSFHQTHLFPFSGHRTKIGKRKGKYYCVNVPLRKGINDNEYNQIFVLIMNKIVDIYHPNVIVMQCGADSLKYDTIGGFNLSIDGHSNCVLHMKSFHLPMLILGGGGYNVEETAKCWTYETSKLLDVKENDLSPDELIVYRNLSTSRNLCENRYTDNNNTNYLSTLTQTIFDNLSHLEV